MSRSHPERPPANVLIADDNRDAADTLALCLQLDGPSCAAPSARHSTAA